MRQVCVLGDGQLGAMLRDAGRRLGLDVETLDPESSDALPESAPRRHAIITAEREHWPDNGFTRNLQAEPGWLNAAAFAALTDRQSQKTLLDDLQLPTAPWCPVTVAANLHSLRTALGGEFLLKRRRGGYDGRGQWRSQTEEKEAMPDWHDEAIAERCIDFSTELSLIGARDAQGNMVFYELTENFHAGGILQISLMQPGRFARWQREAELYHARLMSHLQYQGVLAIEFFVTDAGLLINEVAPRVHNSGHWTQAGASIDQFEMHLRAISGLPLVTPMQPGCSVMVNVIGRAVDPACLALPGTRLHWYGKQERAGRKLGHLNFFHPDAARAAEWLRRLPLDATFAESRERALRALVGPNLAREADMAL
ncbi:MAG: ATP-grasp domain-containing protein [Pseudohongiellaceae bacterium]